MSTCWIIAGPNGAGKTTFALEFLSEGAGCRNFINADLIAAGMNPLSPESQYYAASRIFLREIHTAIRKGKDFAFETTLSGRSYLRLIQQLLYDGWQVELIYLALPDVELSKLRVAERVAHGGHQVPLKDIERRFPRSLQNLLGEYSKLASRTRCFMNERENPTFIYEQNGQQITIHHADYYALLEQGSRR